MKFLFLNYLTVNKMGLKIIVRFKFSIEKNVFRDVLSKATMIKAVTLVGHPK